MAAFDEATAVQARADGTTFDVELGEAWTIGPDRPNGGYLLATMGRAGLAAVAGAGGAQPHPIAANVSYVTSPSVGPALVETEVLRVGRTASQVRARMLQGDRTCVDAMLTYGTLHEGSDPWWGEVPPVELPPEDECRGMGPPPGAEGGRQAPPSFRLSVDERFDPACLGFLSGEPSGGGELRAWFRFADGRDVDPLALLFVADALPPATFDIVSTGWVPTLNLTAYVRAVPAPGPLRIRFRAGMIQDGLVDETSEIWDRRGRLVAQSTQVAALRVPG